mgnify:CR=1 FL=1
MDVPALIRQSEGMNTAFNTATLAMVAAQAQVATAARQIVNPRADESGVIDALVAIKEAETVHAAAASVARTTADMEQRLIDIIA